ncbi:DUF2293 domain-containing protein [Desulfobacter hydrogenophilus]|uniref:DUF2293 domain-containing protein n=2 Tax=Desulfobacter hydrogenophilus TaxID=2291 RepID=A0A328FB02_9BACT|nr:DUF2293 domain-containing protein [Desulfobacter hydrogenophilus]NDY74226.1 DUF2293 domain-containing protein [Desulfobacter hydrogenophilus]QBH14443.1 DUF2293 domain-containing protein [Desulfobacter hydrogenophilus]RAM00197.1 DUF2293 domain-containing protein [Desulfobacter hydrogenophilus]
MAHQHLSVFPGATEGTLHSGAGETLIPPDGWAFLPAGDAVVTKRVKLKSPVWVVQVKYRRRMISKGIWAPAENILAAKQEVAAKRATPAYAKDRKCELARRQAKQEVYTQEFNDQIIKFLNFHSRYEKEAQHLGKIITSHATPVGSGTVARTQRIPIDKRAQAAVIAWMRHKTTVYDSMKVARVKGTRREIRKALAKKSIEVLNVYRQGRDLGDNCPLKQALEKIHDF